MAVAVTEASPRVLVISADKLGSELAGVSIRAYELARQLAAHADVTLAGLETDSPPPADVPSVTYELRRPRALREHIERADVILAQPQWPVIARWLRASSARVVYDLLTPEPFEVLEYLAPRPRARRVVLDLTLDRILGALHTGDRFICAGEKQRDLWVGTLLAERLVTPELHDADPTLRSLIDTVPFGAPSEPPEPPAGSPIRERFPAIREGDDILLWSGGIWNWLDAETAIRAAGTLSERRPGTRLVFMAASGAGPAKEATQRAKALARELGLMDEVVFFNDGWVPYDQRGGWLLDADCALSTHVEHLETRFAFRTRMLDCFWAGLPIVCTRGDELADRVDRDGLGETVPPADPEEAAAAVERVLDNGREAYADALRAAWGDFTWSRVSEPLVRFVTEPGADRAQRPRRRPLHAGRDTAFRAAMGTLNTLGVKRTPFL
jgi:glycosyltransferase involved in cell wall biosynthesis